MKYTNQKGEIIEIGEMADGYLLNAYAKNKARLKNIREKSGDFMGLNIYIINLENTVEALKSEVKKRNLI